LHRTRAGRRVTLWSRIGTDFTDKLPGSRRRVRALPVADALLDGEAVVFRPNGHGDFASLRTTRGAAQGAFVAFDLCILTARTGASCRSRSASDVIGFSVMRRPFESRFLAGYPMATSEGKANASDRFPQP